MYRALLPIIVAGAVFSTLIGSVSAQSSNDSVEKPNILLIYTCQHSGEAMSCAGAEHLETPALDRLAQEGVLFKNAYTPQPVHLTKYASGCTIKSRGPVKDHGQDNKIME